MRHFLDVHAAFGRHDERHAAGFAIDQCGQIQLARDLRAIFHVEALYFFAVRSGLHCDERIAEHLACELLHFVDRLGKTHATARTGRRFLELAFAATTSMDLRFHHPDRAGQCLGGFDGLFDGKRGGTLRRRYAIGTIEILSLIFVNVHILFPSAAIIGMTDSRKSPHTQQGRSSNVPAGRQSSPYRVVAPRCGCPCRSAWRINMISRIAAVWWPTNPCPPDRLSVVKLVAMASTDWRCRTYRLRGV